MTFPATKIVVPVDFSGESKLALESAAGMGGELHCVHVLFPLSQVAPNVTVGDVTDSDRVADAEKKLRDMTEPYAVTSTKILVGKPGHEIADYAGSIGADLIVIPSHGYHGVKRLVLGSVAEKVIRYAECSVLVLRRSDAE